MRKRRFRGVDLFRIVWCVGDKGIGVIRLKVIIGCYSVVEWVFEIFC